MKGRKLFLFFFLITAVVVSSEKPNIDELWEKIESQDVKLRQQESLLNRLAKMEMRVDDLQRFQINSERPIELRMKKAEEKLLSFAKLPELVSQLEARLGGCASKITQNEIQNDVVSLRQKDENLENWIRNEITALKQNVEQQLLSLEEQLKSQQSEVRSTANKVELVEDIVSRHDGLINTSVIAQNKNIVDRFSSLESDTLVGKKDRTMLNDKIKQITDELRQNEAETKSQNMQLSSLNAECSNLSIVLNDLRTQGKFFRAEISHDVIVQPSTNRTALHLAVLDGNLDKVRKLLRNGSNIEAKDFKKKRPLHLAVAIGDVEIARELLANGAEVNSVDGTITTPLHWAAIRSRENCVDLLLDNGANIDARNMWGETPFYKACSAQQRIEVVELLWKRGANINTPKNKRITPLQTAALHGYLNSVKFLVEKGADVHAKDVDGDTAIDFAKLKKHQDIINYLTLHM